MYRRYPIKWSIKAQKKYSKTPKSLKLCRVAPSLPTHHNRMSFQLLLFTLSSLGQPSWSEFPIRTCCPPPKLLAIQDLHNSRQRQDKAGQVMTQLLSIDFSIKFE